MSQTVQIVINVTDANAAEAVQQVVTQLNALGPAGQAAGAEAGAGVDKIGEHAVSSREQVRLLSEEMGLRVPRAMQSVIAQSELLTGAIGAIAPAMIAIGGVDILMHVGESAYAAYEKYILLKGVIDDSNTVIKSFGDSAEAAMNRASDATERYIRLTQGAQAADLYKLTRLQNSPIAIPQYQSDQFKKLPDDVKGDFEKITGESVMPKDLGEAIAKLQTYETSAKNTLAYMQQINATAVVAPGYISGPGSQVGAFPANQVTEQQKRVEIGAALIASLNAQQDEYTAHVKEDQAQIDADNKAKADAAIAKAKEKHDAILALENSARDAQLSGDALLEAQRTQAIDSFVRKYGQSRAAIDAIDSDYASKEIALWQKQWDEADKAMRAASQAAQQQARTGAGSIENDRQNALAGISGNQAPGAADELRAAANLKANTEILAAQKEFTSQMDQIGTHADDQQVQGYARVADEAAQSIRKIQNDWQTLADKVGAVSAAGVDAQLQAADRIQQVNANMEREMEQLHQRTMEEIGKEEEQTARYSLAEWQQQQLRIVDDYQDRVQRIKDLEAQQNAALQADMVADAANTAMYQRAEVMNAQDADAAMLAARRLMNAQMQQSDEETRDRMAQGLQSLFSNPAQFFEKRAMDTAFQLMANEMLSVFKSSSPAGGVLQYLFGMGPQMSTSTNPLDAMSSALGMHGHGTAGLSSATNPAMVQFQQGSTTLLTASQTLMSAASTLQSAAGTMAAGGGIGMGGGGGGINMGGLGGAAVSTASGAGAGAGGGMDLSSMGESANPLMMPGLSGSSSALMSSSTFDNSMMLPGLNGIAADSTLGQTGGAAASGASAMGAAAGIAGGALMAGTSIYSAYQTSNPVSGAVGGALGGMEAGAALGSIIPGLGTVVGGAIGAIAGAIGGLFAGIFGDQGRGQARNLDENTIQPALAKDVQDYEAGRAGYETLAPELNAMLISAQNQTQQMGSGARSYFNQRIQPEIQAVLSSLQKQEIGGRSQITLSAAQYHDGGWTGDFGDLATSGTEGFIHAMQNEFVVNPIAAAAHAPILQAMNSGTNFAYSNNVQPRMPASSASGPQLTVQIQALDSKSVAQWAKAGGGLALMAAINQAQRQYSGVGRG